MLAEALELINALSATAFAVVLLAVIPAGLEWLLKAFLGLIE